MDPPAATRLTGLVGGPVMSADRSLVGGWALGAVVGRRPAGPLREAVEPLTGRRAMFVLVDERFRPAAVPDQDAVIRAASVEHPGIAPMLDAGLLDDGTPWYVCDPLPGPVLDPDASRSPRRALVLAEDVAQALTALHADGVVHGLVGPLTVVPGGGRHGGEPTMLLDAGVGALVGSTAAALAAACGAALPADRGPAADVYALGALLLRLLTSAAVPSAALAALPPDVRALVSSLLDPDPARRPTAGATAARLARLREQVPATGAVSVVPAPVRAPATVHTAAPAAPPAPIRARAPEPAPAPAVRDPMPAPAGAFPPPVPVPAPRTATSPILVPRVAPGMAPSLRTGPSTVIADPFPRPVRTGAARTGAAPLPRQRRGAARRILVAGGVVALGGLLVAVVTHLPSGQEAGVHAIAAGADDAVVGIGGAGDRSATAPTASSLVVAPASGASTAAPGSVALQSVVPTPTPAFLRPVVTAAPLSTARGKAPRATTGSSATITPPTTSATAHPSTTPSSSTPPSSTPSSSTPSSTTPVSSSPSSSTPSSATQPPSSDPTATASTAPATPTPTTASDESATASATPAASVSPTPSDSASPSQVTASTPDPTTAP